LDTWVSFTTTTFSFMEMATEQTRVEVSMLSIVAKKWG